jgi:hypothetical protein
MNLKHIIPRHLHPGACADRVLKAMLRDKIVRSGPFRGMRYIEESQGSVYLPKLVGVYELEIAGVIKSLASQRFKNIYVIGAGEGYYAVGFAMRSPNSTIYAYEANTSAHKLIKELARLNHCEERVIIKGECGESDLSGMSESGVLIVMDVEGAEKVLLDPEGCDPLRTATILFESHYTPEETRDEINARFAGTHEVERYDSKERSWRDLSFLPRAYAFYIRRMLRFWFEEMRGGPMSWYLLRPKPRS